VEKKTIRLYADDRLVCGRDSKKKVGWQVLHTSVSRRHAKITVHKDGRSLEIEDLGSTYGTFVNGVKIERPTRVASGSEIRFAASSRKWWLTKLTFPKTTDNMDEPAMKAYIRVLEKSSEQDLPRRFDDFVQLESLMAHSDLRHLPKYNVKHVVETIESDPLKRLEIFENESKVYFVRTGRFTTGEDRFEDDNLKVMAAVNDPVKELKSVVHYTYFKNWNAIRDKGIVQGRKKRYIYLFENPEDSVEPLSEPFRKRGVPDISITIDLKRATEQGVRFFRTRSNPDVLVTSEHIEPYMFQVAKHVKSKSILLSEKETKRMFTQISKKRQEEKLRKERGAIAEQRKKEQAEIEMRRRAEEREKIMERESRKRKNVYLDRGENEEEEEEEEAGNDESDEDEGDSLGFTFEVSRRKRRKRLNV
jgi:RNA:NAD 2'-phosphotransferase (TPT1/KptA family)